LLKKKSGLCQPTVHDVGDFDLQQAERESERRWRGISGLLRTYITPARQMDVWLLLGMALFSAECFIFSWIGVDSALRAEAFYFFVKRVNDGAA